MIIIEYFCGMKYLDFENVISSTRMNRYLIACNRDTRKAMMLYRLNLRLSQEMFTIISCFEVALRNSIDLHYTSRHGQHWLRDSHLSGGMFDNHRCRNTKRVITKSYNRLTRYFHSKLLAELDFGFWRYLFAQPQYYAGGQSLLAVFPLRPRSSRQIQYNQTYIYNELKLINDLRNRIAHHEPVCFRSRSQIIDSTYIRENHALLIKLFSWMGIDANELLYGLDHIDKLIIQLDTL